MSAGRSQWVNSAHRQARVLGHDPQSAAQLQAAHAGQVEVEQQQIGLRPLQVVPGRFCVPTAGHFLTGLPAITLDNEHDFRHA